MTFNEIRLVQHLVESAHAIAQDDRGAAVLGTYEGFECVMWPDDADLKKWQVTRKQFRRCCEAAFAELKQSEITREKLTPPHPREGRSGQSSPAFAGAAHPIEGK